MKREVYAQAKDWLKQKVKEQEEEGELGGLQHYTVLFPHRPPMKTGAACYANISGKDKVPTGAECIVSLTTHYKGNVPTMENTGEYYEWLIKESPFAPVFKRKNIKQSVEEGIICHTTQRQDLTASALISARMAYEYPMAVRIWTKLVRGGVHPSLAYVLMMTFRESAGLYAVSNYGYGHCVLPSEISRLFAVNFIKGTPHKENMPSFKVFRGYKSNTNMWDKPPSGYCLHKRFHDRFHGKYVGKVSLFGGKVPDGATADQFVEEVLDFQEKFFKENEL